MIGIPIGLITANAIEWAVHKHVLHGLGKEKASLWAFHWHEHHRTCRKHGHRDADYERSVWGPHAQGKEALALFLGTLTVLPLAPVAPFFAGTMVYSAVHYFRTHKRAHLDPDWARAHLPWHYDHHMGPNQNANWCVTRPWFDHLMGTREPYVGTAREARDAERRASRSRRSSPLAA